MPARRRLPLVVLVLALVAPRVARADEPGPAEAEGPRQIVGVGAGAPGTGDLGSFAGLVEGGYRPWSAPLYLHAQLTVGRHTNGNVDSGALVQVRIGLEAWRCKAAAAVCGFASLDGGYEMLRNVRPGPLTGFLLGGRVGLDFGGAVWRGRVAADFSKTVTGDWVASDFFDSQHDWGIFAALELEVVHRF